MLFLFRGHYSILHCFAYPKFKCGFSCDLDGFAGRGITTFPGFALGQDNLAESWKYELTVLLDLFARQLRQLFKEHFDLRSFKLELLGEVIHHF